jgi:hypothetical protein
MALYIALHARARESRSLGMRDDMMASKRPYWCNAWMSGHADVKSVRKSLEGATPTAAASMTAAFAVIFCAAALSAEVSFGDFLQVPIAPGSSSERFRFIAPLLILMGS